MVENKVPFYLQAMFLKINESKKIIADILLPCLGALDLEAPRFLCVLFDKTIR